MRPVRARPQQPDRDQGAEMKEMAREEAAACEARIPELEEEIKGYEKDIIFYCMLYILNALYILTDFIYLWEIGRASCRERV